MQQANIMKTAVLFAKSFSLFFARISEKIMVKTLVISLKIA
jgi:hypothetical protein